MPRYYFPTHEDGRIIPDNEGLDLPDLDAAEREAATAAAEMGRDRLPSGEARDVAVTVLDRDRRPMVTVRITMTVDRHSD